MPVVIFAVIVLPCPRRYLRIHCCFSPEGVALRYLSDVPSGIDRGDRPAAVLLVNLASPADNGSQLSRHVLDGFRLAGHF
jgi:hypothetical protein